MLSLLTVFLSFAPIETTWIMMEKCMALINLCIFISFHQQIIGLVGADGLYPVSSTMKLRKRTYRQTMRKTTLRKLDYLYLFLQNPTISLFTDTDTSLLYQCRFGMITALFIFSDYPFMAYCASNVLFLIRICCWFIIFILSQSLLINLGPFILQMEPMMNEINFLFMVGCSFPYLGIFLFRWFITRMMLSAGIAKWNGSLKWKNLGALTVHYFTQPLPNYLSYFFHNLPVWWHKITCWISLFVEGPICFLALCSLQYRLLAYILFTGLLIVINISGNYGWLGLTSCITCFSLLDDSVFTIFDYRYKYAGNDTNNCFYLCVESLFVIIGTMHWCLSWFPLSRVAGIKNIKFLGVKRILYAFEDLFAITRHLRIANRYCMFAAMHDYRYEFVLQGSDDNIHWKNYEFKAKPQYNEYAVAPTTPIHWARLDWMIWFIPLRLARNLNHFAYGKYINSKYNHNVPQWFSVFMEQLLKGNQSVISLLKYNPFYNAPPKYIRTAVYRYDIPVKDSGDKRWWIISGPKAYISTQSEVLRQQ